MNSKGMVPTNHLQPHQHYNNGVSTPISRGGLQQINSQNINNNYNSNQGYSRSLTPMHIGGGSYANPKSVGGNQQNNYNMDSFGGNNNSNNINNW